MHSARTTKAIDLTLHDGARLSKDPKERVNRCDAMLQEDGGNALWRLFSNSSSEKRERIWTARRKAAVGASFA